MMVLPARLTCIFVPVTLQVLARRRLQENTLLDELKRDSIARLWNRKLGQDARKIPQSERHRNLEPDSAEFICALAAGCHAESITLPIGKGLEITRILGT